VYRVVEAFSLNAMLIFTINNNNNRLMMQQIPNNSDEKLNKENHKKLQ